MYSVMLAVVLTGSVEVPDWGRRHGRHSRCSSYSSGYVAPSVSYGCAGYSSGGGISYGGMVSPGYGMGGPMPGGGPYPGPQGGGMGGQGGQGGGQGGQETERSL